MEEEHPCRGSPWGKGPGVESACVQEWQKEGKQRGFPGGAVVKDPPANAEHSGSSPGPGRSHMPRSN